VDKISEYEKEYCIISIDDNGPGINDDRKKELFKRFKTGGTSTKGTGLGLYLVKTIVESFDGKVWIEDRVPGDHTQGSKFMILLPAIEDQ
jgi:signal transduction histidine kinase